MPAGLPLSSGADPDRNIPTDPIGAGFDPVTPIVVPTTAAKYLLEIEQAEKDMQRYLRRCKKIVKIYTEQIRDETRTDRQYAILWANTEVLKPAIYSRPPKPVVSRRFNDPDPTGRAASDVLERSLVSTFERSEVHKTMIGVRDDFVLVARGTAWVRYEPQFETLNLGDAEEPFESLTDETLKYDFVGWADLVHPKAMQWSDLPWIARRVYLDKQAFIARFGEELYNECAPKEGDGVTPRSDNANKQQPKNTTCVYELWSRRDNEVVWLTKNCQEFLDRQPPLYNLHGFFPCPEPAYGTRATDSLTPIPDYIYYQDQAEEINTLTAKIGGLQDALKLTGFYPAGAEGDISSAIERAAAPSASNQMVPVPAWSVFVQGGGSKQMIEWWPVDTVITVLKGAIELRKQLIEDVYQITGISDILRGATQASETATAQQIKAQWGGIRIRDRQQEIARFARDLARISAEIISEKFQPETIWRMTGLKFPTKQEKLQAEAIAKQVQQQAAMAVQQPQGAEAPQQVGGGQQAPIADVELPDEIQRILDMPTQEDLIQLLRDDQTRSYRIDIETDSTIAADEQAQQESINQFVTAVGGFVGQALPVAQQVPELVPVLGEVLTLVARAYRGGRQLEDTIEQSVEKLEQKAAKALKGPPPPNPEIMKVELQAKTSEQEMALRQQESVGKLTIEQERLNIEREKMAKEEMRGQLDGTLRIAAHNKQMIGEAKQLADQRLADEMREPTALEAMGSSMGQQLTEIGAAIVQGQQQLAQALALIVQENRAVAAQAEQRALVYEQRCDAQDAVLQSLLQSQQAVLAAIQAPKRIVRDQQGRAQGVEIAQTLQ